MSYRVQLEEGGSVTREIKHAASRRRRRPKERHDHDYQVAPPGRGKGVKNERESANDQTFTECRAGTPAREIAARY